ncbi:hypothetical protein, partial [Pseudomonas putida]|uniref:hypothetical protein n=1 Tax=Pseudomonas putida TaxID=303 RepID=UPI001C83B513
HPAHCPAATAHTPWLLHRAAIEHRPQRHIALIALCKRRAFLFANCQCSFTRPQRAKPINLSKISHTAISDPISMSLKQQLYTFRNTDSTPPAAKQCLIAYPY